MAVIRLDGRSRRKLIEDAVRKVAAEKGVLHVTHESVAAACAVETSEATVRRYFHTAADLRGVVDDHP